MDAMGDLAEVNNHGSFLGDGRAQARRPRHLAPCDVGNWFGILEFWDVLSGFELKLQKPEAVPC